MAKRKRDGSLASEEKRVVKALIAEGMRHQDIQDLVNRGRKATINSARVTEVKKDNNQKSANQREVETFKLKKTYYDPITGLNEIEHERLIRSREAMMMAVNVFNSPSLRFRTEQFAVLANIAWTYLLHEHHDVQLKENILKKNGETVSLHELIKRPTCPISKNMKRNLDAVKEIRDAVEHRLFGRSDESWLGIFQACCVNYENTICDLFGTELSLQANLGFALQFSRLSLEQISDTQEFAIPANIQALDARLNSASEKDADQSAEYKFQVVYTLDSSSRSGANIRFISPDSEEGEAIHNVLVKAKSTDDLYPHKPSVVADKVSKAVPDFSSHTHQLAWKKHKARPATNAKKPDQTDRRFCIYHSAHNDYTYSNEWVEFLTATYQKPGALEALRFGHKAKS